MKLEARLNGEKVGPQQRVSFASCARLHDGEGIFQLSDTVAHLGDLLMQPVGVCKDEPGRTSHMIIVQRVTAD